MVTQCDRRLLFGLSLVAVAGLAGWLLIPSLAQTQPDPVLHLAAASTPEDGPVAEPPPAIAPDRVDLDRIRLARQSFRRGGLGSLALMTFTVRNANDYDVKDLELLCAFKSRDGHYVTERRKQLAETIGMKSRKAIPTTLIGFVNVRASQARCSLVTASRA